MSFFWTTARHVVSSCRCTICRSSKNNLQHRPHVNTPPIKLNTRIGDATTLFYGTVMAAALYTDASAKINKRRKLEGDICQAKGEAQLLGESNRQRLQALGSGNLSNLDDQIGLSKIPDTVQSKKSEFRELRAASSTRLRYIEKTANLLEGNLKHAVSNDTKIKLRSELNRLKNALSREKKRLFGGPQWQPAKFERLRHRKHLRRIAEKQLENQVQETKQQSMLRFHLLSSMLTVDTSHLSEMSGSERSNEELWNDRSTTKATPYLIKRHEIVITRLILLLLESASKDDQTLQRKLEMEPLFQGFNAWENIKERLDDIERQLRTLKSLRSSKQNVSELRTSTIVNYSGAPDDEYERMKARQELNTDLCQIFALHDGSEHIILSICHKLASSSVSPDLHTFNVLLVNLSRLQQYRAAEIVWYSLRMSGTSCNEISVATILKVYAALGYDKKFCSIADQIDVKNGEGLIPLNSSTMELATALPELVSEPFRPGASWMSPSRPFDTMEIRYLRVPKNADICEALVTGYLDIGDMEKACEEFTLSIRARFSPRLEVLNAILFCILSAKDRELGLTLSRWILDGKFDGTQCAAIDSVYLMAELASLPLNKKSKMPKQMAMLAEVNAFAMRHGHITRPLEARDLGNLTDRELRTAGERLMHCRRISKPLLNLRFSIDQTENFTATTNYETITRKQQPTNLVEYAATKLSYLYKTQFKRYGQLLGSKDVPNDTARASRLAIRWIMYHRGAHVNENEKMNESSKNARTEAAYLDSIDHADVDRAKLTQRPISNVIDKLANELESVRVTPSRTQPIPTVKTTHKVESIREQLMFQHAPAFSPDTDPVVAAEQSAYQHAVDDNDRRVKSRTRDATYKPSQVHHKHHWILRGSAVAYI